MFVPREARTARGTQTYEQTYEGSDGVGSERFSTAARLRAIGQEAQARVYRAAATRRPSRRNRLTGRAALLALVLCALVVALAYPTRQYIAQRSDIADQRREAQQAKKKVEELREQRARWQDPEYVRTKAREQLHYVMPGEDGYSMASPAPTGDAGKHAAAGSQDDADARAAAARRPWYANLWDGVDHADATAAQRR